MNDAFMEDNEIINRCLCGDTEAFEGIVTRYQEPVLALCWSIMRNAEEARDAAQDAFAQAFCHLSGYDPNRSFKNWLYSIAYHKCLDKIRKNKSFSLYLRKSGTGAWTDDPDPDLSPPAGFSDELGALLDKLKDKERMALLLNARDGYSAVEIAEVLRCAESTARVYIHNARRKLRKWLKEKSIVPSV
jgi:RNA polymerase sigma-70 factor (ECF subfamily)